MVADVREGGSWSPLQKVKNDVICVVVRCALAGARRAPRPIVAAACALIALVAYALLPRARARVAERARAAGLKGDRAFVVRAFRQMGAMLADTVALYRADERADSTLVLDPESRRVFAEALREGRGVVFVSAHLGSWERLAAVLAEGGFPVATVARESYDPRLTRIVYDDLRRPRGVRSIYRGDPTSALRIGRELAAGRAVGFLLDLPVRRAPSIRVELFGERTRMPLGAARIALARRAAVVVGTVTNVKSSRRRVIRITRVAPHANERTTLDAIARELDARIAAWPEAWLGLFADGDPKEGLRLETNPG